MLKRIFSSRASGFVITIALLALLGQSFSGAKAVNSNSPAMGDVLYRALTTL